MSYRWKLIFILGVSGSWKNTVIHEMLNTDLGLQQVISCKTRELRPGEKDGVDYCYLTQEQFEEKRDKGEFLEYALIHKTFRYATRKKDVVDKLEAGEHVIKEIDIQWLISISQEHSDVREVTRSIFLNIDDEVMIDRITKRAPLSEEELTKRLESAVMERDMAKQYCTDMIDASGSVEEVAAHVYQIISWYISESK